MQAGKVTYERRRPERTTLYDVVRDNVETLYAAMEDNERVIPKFAAKGAGGISELRTALWRLCPTQVRGVQRAAAGRVQL